MALLKEPEEAVFTEQNALYLFAPNRLVKKLTLELCPAENSPSLIYHANPAASCGCAVLNLDLTWPPSLRSLALTPIQRPEMYIIGAQPLCSQLSGLSQVSSCLPALGFHRSHNMIAVMDGGTLIPGLLCCSTTSASRTSFPQLL